MIQKLSKKISCYIIAEGIKSESDLEVLDYGIRKILNYMIQIVVLTISAAALHLIVNTFAFTIFYATLRTKVGGAHSSSRFGCLGIFTALALAASVLSVSTPDIMIRPISITIAIISVLLVTALAPVTHSNAPKRKQTLQKCKKQGRIIVLAECLIVLLSCLLMPAQVSTYIFSASLGMGTVSLFLVIPAFQIEGRETDEEV